MPIATFRLLAAFVFVFCLSTKAFSSDKNHLDSIPDVFLLGEYESSYEKLVASCSNPLLNVAGNSIDDASKHWLVFLHDIEKFAAKNDFDINGVKIWMSVFWNADGSIGHIAYYPKPKSRNIDFMKFTQMLRIFAVKYKLKLKSTDCFSHNSIASFPSFADVYLKQGK
jgi:hypothetical protein